MDVYIQSSKAWEKCDLIKENVKTAVVGVEFHRGIVSRIIGDKKEFRNKGYHVIKKPKTQIAGLI